MNKEKIIDKIKDNLINILAVLGIIIAIPISISVGD